VHNKKLQSDSANCHAFCAAKNVTACFAVELGVI
jgi:hypothetical protein